MIPLNAMLDAGRYFLRKQQRSTGVSDAELIKIAIKSMGLDELAPFDPREKIIEYVLEGQGGGKLVDLTLRDFTLVTASESVAPGGGSVAAAVGAFGAALGTMVANLSSHKRGWDDRWEEFSDHAEAGKACHDELLRLIDADTDSFNEIMAAFRLPQGTDEEKRARHDAVQIATRGAIDVPFRTMEVALEAMDLIKQMAEKGLPASISDAAVGALCARTAVRGAFFNVQVNSKDLEDAAAVEDYASRGRAIVDRAGELEAEILGIVEAKLTNDRGDAMSRRATLEQDTHEGSGPPERTRAAHGARPDRAAGDPPGRTSTPERRWRTACASVPARDRRRGRARHRRAGRRERRPADACTSVAARASGPVP